MSDCCNEELPKPLFSIKAEDSSSSDVSQYPLFGIKEGDSEDNCPTAIKPALDIEEPVIFDRHGLSAYEIWLAYGNVGSELDFLNSLRAPKEGVLQAADTTVDSVTNKATVNNFKYLRSGVEYSIHGAIIDLDPKDATYNRIDLLYVNSSNVLSKITGVAGESAIVPQTPVGGIKIAEILRNVNGTNTVTSSPTEEYATKTYVDANKLDKVLNIGKGLMMSSDKLTLDLESKTLVSPTITPTWTAYKNDGLTAYLLDADNISNNKTITADKGAKVNLSATYKYPVPSSIQAAPTSVSGSFGTTLPAANVDSAPLNVNTIGTDQSYSVTLAKAKSGLIVVNGQVQFASGNDTTSDSISISFLGRGVLMYSVNASLTAAEIEAQLNGASFQSSKARTFTGVTVTGGKYTYYIYDAALGNVTSVIQNGALPVFNAFQFLAQVSITNAAGLLMPVIVFRSNATDAFNNATLAFS